MLPFLPNEYVKVRNFTNGAPPNAATHISATPAPGVDFTTSHMTFDLDSSHVHICGDSVCCGGARSNFWDLRKAMVCESLPPGPARETAMCQVVMLIKLQTNVLSGQQGKANTHGNVAFQWVLHVAGVTSTSCGFRLKSQLPPKDNAKKAGRGTKRAAPAGGRGAKRMGLTPTADLDNGSDTSAPVSSDSAYSASDGSSAYAEELEGLCVQWDEDCEVSSAPVDAVPAGPAQAGMCQVAMSRHSHLGMATGGVVCHDVRVAPNDGQAPMAAMAAMAAMAVDQEEIDSGYVVSVPQAIAPPQLALQVPQRANSLDADLVGFFGDVVAPLERTVTDLGGGGILNRCASDVSMGDADVMEGSGVVLQGHGFQ